MVNLSHPNFLGGEEGEARLGISTKTDGTAHRIVKVLPGENLAELTKRVYGSNTELNRHRITANNHEISGEVKIVNV